MNLRTANAMIEHALVKAGELASPPLAVVVLDPSGHLVAGQRQDGASMFRIDVALGKAWTAVAMGLSSRAVASRASTNPNFFVALAATAAGQFLPQPGAVLIRDDGGAILGAIGASGASADVDEACCAHGVRMIGLTPDLDA